MKHCWTICKFITLYATVVNVYYCLGQKHIVKLLVKVPALAFSTRLPKNFAARVLHTSSCLLNKSMAPEKLQ